MKNKIIQVFYNENGYPFKDKERTVPFPVSGASFVGSSNVTKIRFYFDEIGTENDTWVATSKLPNGRLGSEILEVDHDDELNENFATLSLSSFYTQFKGDIFIGLQGYEGGVNLTYNSTTGLYEVSGTPTIQACQPIKMSVAYSPMFNGSGNQEQNITQQALLALIGTKLDENSPNIIRVVPTIEGLDLTDFDDDQIFYNQLDKKFYQLEDGELVDYTIFNPGDTFVMAESTDYVIPIEDR